MPILEVVYQPRKSICSSKNTFSILGKLTNIGGYIAGVFKNSFTAISLNFIGYVVSRVVDYYSFKDKLKFFNDETASADNRSNVLLSGRGIGVDIGVTDMPPSDAIIDRIGIKSDYCTSSAGKVTSTLQIAAHLCQVTSTVLNFVRANQENAENTNLAIGAAATGALAMGIPYLLNHLRTENAGRAITAVTRLNALATAAITIGDKLSPATKARVRTDLNRRRQ